MNTGTANKKVKVVKTSVSIRRDIFKAASRKAFDDGRPFSNYIQRLIERDLESQRAS